MDVLGQSCNVSVDFGVSLFGNWVDKSDDLKTLVETYSHGVVIGRSDNMSHSYAVPEKGTPVDGYATVDQKAMIIMRENWSGKNRRIEIPAPLPSMFYDVEDQGFRVTPAAGSNIATMFSSLLPTGKTVSFVRGWLKSKQ